MLSESQMLERKEQLIVRRDALVSRLNAIKNDYAGGLDADWEEQATQLENAEVLQEISRVTAEELSEVERGIERLEEAIEKLH